MSIFNLPPGKGIHSLYRSRKNSKGKMEEIDAEKNSILNPKMNTAATTNDQSLEYSGNQNIQEIKEISDKRQKIKDIKDSISKDLQLESLNDNEIKMENLLGNFTEDSTIKLTRNLKPEQPKDVKSETMEGRVSFEKNHNISKDSQIQSLSDNEIKTENLLGDNQDLAEDSSITLEKKLKPEPKEVERERKESVKHDGSTEGRVTFEKDHIEKHYDRTTVYGDIKPSPETNGLSHKRHWILGALGRVLGLDHTLGALSSIGPEFAPIRIPISRRLETFGVFFWMSTFLFMGFGSLGLLIYVFLYTKYWWVSLCYLTWYLGDRSICNRGGRRLEWVRQWSLWKHMARFFPAHLIKTVELDPSRNYIMGYHPHGILSAGAFVNYATEGTGFSKIFPGFSPYLLTLAGHFHLPFYREFFLSSGSVSATRESMDYLLGREGGGRALCLVVGGAKESLDCHPGQVILHLSKRKGFCKMALRHGTPLVPMFSFGENDIYDQVPNPEGSLVRRIQNYLQKVIGLAPCIVLGRGIFQYSFGIVPYRHAIYTVVGAPIEVPHVQYPSKEQIVDLHGKYVEAVKELYNKYKHKYAADPSVEIQIV